MGILFLFGFGVLLLNMASAGAAALLAVIARDTSRRRRTVWACAVTGLIAMLMLGGLLLEQNMETRSLAMMGVSLAFIFTVGTAVALPGAILMSRLAERPPAVGDTFA
ncbi:MAG: hypothetical protein ABIT10_05450 [Alteraurantiacibacter sp.]